VWVRWWGSKATRSFKVTHVRAIGIAPLECRSCCYLLPYHYVMSLPRIRVVVAHSLGHSWKFVIVVQGAECQVIVASLP